MKPSPHSETLHASAPGSLMLMGEHAVLHGSHALCAAVNRRMHLRLFPRTDREFELQSALGRFEGHLDDFEVCKPFQFVLAALRKKRPDCGFRLEIRSEFSDQIGFGSSAAVTVAALTLLRALRGESFNRAAVLEEALEVVRDIQGAASGSDLAAAVYGGVVHYRAEPLRLESLHCAFPLSVCYAGYKTPTPEVIRRVELLRKQYPERYQEIFQMIDHCVEEAVAALRQGNLPRLGGLFNLHHGLQSAMGTSDETLEFLVHELRTKEGVLGTKISGSGLGDCVIALGNADAKVNSYDHYSVEIDSQGVSLAP
ncbi:MAG: mevalonate kinase [Kiritimatiellia bacterium]